MHAVHVGIEPHGFTGTLGAAGIDAAADFLAVISFVAASMMPDYTGKDISVDAYSDD